MSKITTADEAFEQLDAALELLAGVELAPDDVPAALSLVHQVERASRRVRAVQLGVLGVVEERELFRADGHTSGRVMVEHANHLSEPEAKRRDRARRALADLPAVRAGLTAGLIGGCQVDRIARVYVNPRVQEAFVALDQQIAMLAAALPYPEFDRRLTNWVRQVDEDGTADRARRCHENRKAGLVQEYEGGWALLGGFGSLTGAQMHAILQAFTEAEFQADWAEAREIHGEATTVAHLARTFDQRSADAMTRIFLLAADAMAASPGGSSIDLTVVMDVESFERELLRAAGQEVPPRPPVDLGPLPDAPDPYGPEPESESALESGAAAEAPEGSAGTPGFRCETIDGHPVDPTEAFAAALVGRVRRAVVGWDGVVLDVSGYHRLFTGPLRDAVKLERTTCYWPGCNASVKHCQIDHLEPRRNGGRTNPGNGAPACGRHNRLKEHGFTVQRDARGRLHVYRPDGVEVE